MARGARAAPRPPGGRSLRGLHREGDQGRVRSVPGLRDTSTVRALAPLVLLLLPSAGPAAGDAETPAVALEGEVLLRLEAAAHFDLLGQLIEPGRRPERSLSRVRPRLTLAPAEGLVLVAQGQWYAAYGPEGDGTGSVYQAYAELQRGATTVRAGRQEIVLGSGFVLGADSFFDGASFDALRVTHAAGAAVSLEAFGGAYVEENAGGVSGALYGAVVRVGDLERQAVEVYGIHDEGGSLATDTLGVRTLLVRGPVAVELEPVRQTGWTDGVPVAAWGGRTELAYTWEQVAHEPRVTVGHAWGTGDARADDRRSREFLHPNNDTGQVGDIGVFATLSSIDIGPARASGLSAASLRIELPLGASTRVSSVVHTFRADAVSGATSRRLGREIGVTMSRTLSGSVTLTASASRFDGGAFFVESLGRAPRVTYGWLGLDLSF